MALKECRECGNPVSSEASVCPHCGVKNPVPGLTKGAKIFLGFLVVIGFIAIIIPSQPDNPTAATTSPEAPSQEMAYQSVASPDLMQKFSFQQQGDKFLVTFDPFLPRNDNAFKQALWEVAKAAYGNHKLVDMQPKLVPRGSANALILEAENSNFVFLPSKEEGTGKVIGLMTWQEPK